MDSVPDDADILFIFAPAKDISEDEASKIISYLENGGKALIVSNYSSEEMPNFASVLENYGVKTADAIIIFLRIHPICFQISKVMTLLQACHLAVDIF